MYHYSTIYALLLEELMCECMPASSETLLLGTRTLKASFTDNITSYKMANLTSDFDYDAALAADTTAAGSPVGSLVRIRVVSAKGLKNKEQFGGIPDPYCEFR